MRPADSESRIGALQAAFASATSQDGVTSTAGRPEPPAVPPGDGGQNGRSPSPNAIRNPQPEIRTSQKVIKFSKVSKRFILHHERPSSFQDMVVSLFGLRTLSKRGVALPRPANEEFWALRDVNFGIYSGEVVGIIGENGSGKSTTLKLITKILEPTSGSVSVKGKVSALLELGTGFHPELTGRENIFLNGSLLGIPRKDMAERYESIVDFAELQEFIDTPIKHYSSGMIMRLGFAVAINVDPDILLTDEVLAVGDEAFQRKCLDHIAALRRRGVTIVFVSHALDAVRSLCRRVLWLDKGRLVADGPAGEVIDQYLAYENAKHAERMRAEHEGSKALQAAKVEAPMPLVAEEAETDSPGADGAHPPAHPGPRAEDLRGKVKITDVQFLDGHGEETLLFLTGQPMTIRIFYEAQKRLEKPVFGVALYTENGVHINGPNTKFARVDIPEIEGTGHVDYHVDELPLLAGRYDVTVAVTGYELVDLYDHQHRAYSFFVQPTPGMSERWGLVNIPSHWDFEPDSPASAQETKEERP